MIESLWPVKRRKGMECQRGLLAAHNGEDRFFFGSKNPKLRALAHKEAHKAMAVGGGVKVAYRKLPARKGVHARTAKKLA